MDINEATKVIRDNINLKTDFALKNAAIKLDIDEHNVERYYLSKRQCLEVAQAFMVLAANIQRSEIQ